MSVDAGSVYSSIRVRLGDLDNDLKGVYARLNQLEGNITKATTNGAGGFKSMFAAVVTGQAVLGLAQKGFALLTGAIKDSIRVATESQEMISRYDVVFDGMGSASEEAAKRFADSFDLAGATAKEMLSNTGNLLQGMGATKEESLALSEQVNVLASDLASFTNNQGGAKVASEALTKALLGEREQAKTLGIAILESDVQLRLAKKGQDNLTGTALKLAKAQATLELITEQAKNSIGDYARTQESAANTQKRAAESTKELQIAVGTALNPAITLAADIWAKVSGALADVITKQNKLRDANKAIADGTETTDQALLSLTDKYEKAGAALKQLSNYGASYINPYTGEKIADTIKNQQALIDNIRNEIGLYQQKKNVESQIDIYKRQANATAEKESKRQLDLLNEKIAREKEAADALKAQIEGRKQAEKEYNDAIKRTSYDRAKGLTTEEDALDDNLRATMNYINALYELGYANENEIGTKGRDALDSLIAKYPELTAEIKALADAETERDEAKKKQDEEEQERIDNIKTGINATGNAISAMTEALVLGEDVWGAFAKSGLNAIAAILEAFAAELAAQAAKSIAYAWSTAGVSLTGAIPALSGSAAAYASAGLVRGAAASFATGGIVEPRGTGTVVEVAENGYRETMFNDGPSGQGFTEQMAGYIATSLAGRLVVEMDARQVGKMVQRQNGSNKR